MRISIIIRTKDEERHIADLLEKIFTQEIDEPFEVVVVDSGSSDRTLDIVRRYDVKVLGIPQSKFSYGYSLNYGIAHSPGDIICSLSAHCIPCNDQWLSELVRPIMEGKAHATYGRQVPARGVNPFEERFLETHFGAEEKTTGRVSFSNANCAFLRQMWDGVKFDECITGWEDYLWYLLARDRFVFSYAPKSCVIHSHAFSVKRAARIARQDGRAIRYMREKYGLDILEEKSSVSGKLRYATRDMAGHAVFFLKKGYFGAMLILPFLKGYSYLNYWRGYNSSPRKNDEPGNRTQA